MSVKVTGQFVPAGDFSIVDGKDISGNITVSGTVDGVDIASGTASFGALNLDTLFRYGSSIWQESAGTNTFTGSKFTFKSSDSTDLLRVHNSNDELVFRVGDGFVVLNAQSSPPTAVSGGVYYGTNDEWYLGFDS